MERRIPGGCRGAVSKSHIDTAASPAIAHDCERLVASALLPSAYTDCPSDPPSRRPRADHSLPVSETSRRTLHHPQHRNWASFEAGVVGPGRYRDHNDWMRRTGYCWTASKPNGHFDTGSSFRIQHTAGEQKRARGSCVRLRRNSWVFGRPAEDPPGSGSADEERKRERSVRERKK